MLGDISSNFFFFNFYLFMFGCAGGSSLLSGLFPGCGNWGLLLSYGPQASHGGGFSCCRTRALEHRLST